MPAVCCIWYCWLSLFWRVNYTLKKLEVCIPRKFPLPLTVLPYTSPPFHEMWEIFLSFSYTASNHEWLCLQLLKRFISETQYLICNLKFHPKQLCVIIEQRDSIPKQTNKQTGLYSNCFPIYSCNWWMIDWWLICRSTLSPSTMWVSK